MYILFTALEVACLFGAFYALTRCIKSLDDTHKAEFRIEKTGLALAAERHRIASCERELATMTRWLQKLEGKFNASQRDLGQRDAEERIADAHVQLISAPYCENYEIAQREGPTSKAAACECNYCKGRRAAKDAFRRGHARAGHLDPTWVKAHAGGQVDVEEN